MSLNGRLQIAGGMRLQPVHGKQLDVINGIRMPDRVFITPTAANGVPIPGHEQTPVRG